MTNSNRRIGWPLLWTLVAALILLLEGIALGRPQTGDTLSEVLRTTLRFDIVGRLILLPLWSWLTWHWILRPLHGPAFAWQDLVAIGLGLAYAMWEIVMIYR